MISNFPYLLKELKASACEPDVQNMLAANAARIARINMIVSCLLTMEPAERTVGLKLPSKTISAPKNRTTFERLTNPIGKLTDVASAQTRSNRILMVVLNKIVALVALVLAALSVIQSRH